MSSSIASGQYLNADELVFVSGMSCPMNLRLYEVFEEQLRFENRILISRFLVPGSKGYVEILALLHKKLKQKGYSTNIVVPEFYKVRS